MLDVIKNIPFSLDPKKPGDDEFEEPIEDLESEDDLYDDEDEDDYEGDDDFDDED